MPPDYSYQSAINFNGHGRLDAKVTVDSWTTKYMRLYVTNATNNNVGASIILGSEPIYAADAHWAEIKAGDIHLSAARKVRMYTTESTGEVFVDRSTFVIDQASADGFAVKLRSSEDIAHGMTALAATDIYGAMGKSNPTTGGLAVNGYTEGTVGVNLSSYVTSGNTTTGGAAYAAVEAGGAIRSGTGVVAMGDTHNLFAVKNAATAKFIVKGNGNFHYDGAGSAFDNHDDVGLLQALSRETFSGTVAGVWDRFVTYNRGHLIAAGVLSGDGFINGVALDRLLIGAVWQMHERLAALEAKLSSQSDRVG